MGIMKLKQTSKKKQNWKNVNYEMNKDMTRGSNHVCNHVMQQAWVK